MSETPVPETLETIAAKLRTVAASINALSKSNEERFAKVDKRFDKIDERFVAVDQRFAKIDEQFEETRAQLGVKIEAVDERVAQAYDALIAMRESAERNDKEPRSFTQRLDNHDIRILAPEKPGPSTSQT